MAETKQGSLQQAYGFEEKLAESHAASDLPFWEPVYREAFGDFAAMIDHRQNGWHQIAGIDRSIVLQSSKVILIDEKVRGRNKRTQQVYPDIALEYVSNNRTNTPGWVCKSLSCDYIAYAIAPLGICYLLPVLQLQKAWRENGESWLRKFRREYHKAQNQFYETLFCPVPVDVLFPAMGKSLRITFDEIEISGDMD